MIKENKLPTVITTSIVRTAKEKQTHGYIYVVDLESDKVLLKKKWNSEDISFEGRGGERGLRGVEFYNEKIYIGSGTKLLEFNKELELVAAYTNEYLSDIHELSRNGNQLAIASSGTDSVIVFDLDSKVFTKGYAVEIINNKYKRKFIYRLINKYCIPLFSLSRSLSNYKYIQFDPNAKGGPLRITEREVNKQIHINTVAYFGDQLYFSGTLSNFQFCIDKEELKIHAVLPLITHNVLPFSKKKVVFHKTKADKICINSVNGFRKKTFNIPKFNVADLENYSGKKGEAVPGWGRGLCFNKENNILISGTSPATIFVFNLESGELIKSVQLSRDTRDAIHGLEVLPFNINVT